MIRIHTIGAGGGSLARVDAGGLLQVGPESAGADPGPLCYGRGGKECTITDAQVWLGRLPPDHFLGGTMTLQPDHIGTPLSRLARRLRLSQEETAEGILRVANANMARALRVISLERGHDPRAFTLVAFGGAGGLHACELAASLEIPRVLIPKHPGILSAFGMAHADWVRDYVQTLLLTCRPGMLPKIRQAFRHLEQKARADARRQGFRNQTLALQHEVDLRYRGQSYELTLPWHRNLVAHFERAHRKRYGYHHAGRAVEVVNVRVQVRSRQRRVLPPEGVPPCSTVRAAGALLPAPPAASCDPVSSRLYWRGKTWLARYYAREALRPEQKIRGPAVLCEYSGTTFVPPRWVARCDHVKNLLIEPKA